MKTPVLATLWVILTVALPLSWRAASADSVTINPLKDNTIFSESDTLSNGEGQHLFVGRTLGGALRRALVAFDVAGSVPAGSQIDSVALTLDMNKTISAAFAATLHRVTMDWGEGASDAVGEEGRGAPAQPGDATWKHAEFMTITWSALGGDFVVVASDSISVDGVGAYTWAAPALVADVQMWLDTPGTNFGWIVIGNESVTATAKRFYSSEGSSPPALYIEYTVGTPVKHETWGTIKSIYRD
jgi:hypothetical protein